MSICVEEVEFIRALNLKWNVIANILGVSRTALYRRLKELGILHDLQFSQLSDSDRDAEQSN